MASVMQQLPTVTHRILWRKTFLRHARLPMAFVLGCALVTALSLPYLHLDSQSNNMASEITELSRRRVELKRQVSELQRQLAAKGSLSNVTKRAIALDLQESPQISVLVVDYEPLERAPDAPSPIAQSLDWFKAFVGGSRDEQGGAP